MKSQREGRHDGIDIAEAVLDLMDRGQDEPVVLSPEGALRFEALLQERVATSSDPNRHLQAICGLIGTFEELGYTNAALELTRALVESRTARRLMAPLS